MTPAVTIRPITRDDIDGFWRALCSVIDEKVYLATNAHPPIERTRAFIEKSVSNGWVQFVAVDHDTVVGWCDILARDEALPGLGVTGMGLMAPYRGKGIGERLLRTALAAAQDKGFDTIRLDVWAENAPAIALYHKVGFEHVRAYTKPEKPERMLHDMIWRGFTFAHDARGAS